MSVNMFIILIIINMKFVEPPYLEIYIKQKTENATQVQVNDTTKMVRGFART